VLTHAGSRSHFHALIESRRLSGHVDEIEPRPGATWLLAEYWRAKQAEDLKLVRALSTPGLTERVEQRFPGYTARAVPPEIADQAGVEARLLTYAGIRLGMGSCWPPRLAWAPS
jgi:hypothetical protein